MANGGTLAKLFVSLGVDTSSAAGGLLALRSNIGGLSSASSRVASDVEGNLNRIGKSGQGAATMLRAATAASLAVSAATVTIGVVAVDMANKYEKSTGMLAASMGITKDQAKAIGDEFLTTGGKSVYSAQKILDAFTPVAGQLATLNGGVLNATQSLNFMDTATTLAEASGKDLNTTTAALAQVMQAYNIPLSKAASTSDVLFNVSTALNLPLIDIVGTVDRLHAKLGPLAPSLGDVSTLMLDLAEHGLTGGRALNLVSGGLNTLLSDSKPVNAELAALGVNLFDSNRNFVGMQSVLAQLRPALAGMTQEQRLHTEQVLFGKNANKALDDTIMAGLPGWDAAAKAVNAAGTAQTAAKVATDNASSSWQRMGSRVHDDLIKIGEGIKNVGGVILPPFIAALGFIADHFVTIVAVAGPVAGVLAGLWLTDKVVGWGRTAISTIESVISKLGSGGLSGALSKVFPNLFGGGGGGVSGGAVSKLAPQDVFIVGASPAFIAELRAGAGGGLPTGKGLPTPIGKVAPVSEAGGGIVDSLVNVGKIVARWAGPAALVLVGTETIAAHLHQIGQLTADHSVRTKNYYDIENGAQATGLAAVQQTGSKQLATSGLWAQLQADTGGFLDRVTTNYSGMQDALATSLGYTGKFSGGLAHAPQLAQDLTTLYQNHQITTQAQFNDVVSYWAQTLRIQSGVPPTMAQIVNHLLSVQAEAALANQSGAGFSYNLQVLRDRTGASVNAIISAYTQSAGFAQQALNASLYLAQGWQREANFIASRPLGSFAEGGVVNAPSAGMMAILHGNEAILPREKSAPWLWDLVLNSIATGRTPDAPVRTVPVPTPATPGMSRVSGNGASDFDYEAMALAFQNVSRRNDRRDDQLMRRLLNALENRGGGSKIPAGLQ